MIPLLALLLIGPTTALEGLDTIPPAEVSRIAGEDPSVRAEIGRISNCLRGPAEASECLAQDGCTLQNPSACAHVSAEAWLTYGRRYLALLTADAKVGPVAQASQKSWEESTQADCAIDAAVGEVRKLPFQGYYGELCLAGAAQTRALALRDFVINLYDDASVQGGDPYPGHSPFAAGKP